MSEDTTDLTACDREPIHLSGAIQPFGCLVAINLSSCTVEFASKNVSDFLKLDVKSALLAPQDAIEAALAVKPISYINRFSSGDHLIIELQEESTPEPGAADQLLEEIKSLTESKSLNELLETMADAMQRLTRFERVMIYKFSPDWSGTVIAEAIAGPMPSFMDLRFPASDIPIQARRLYSENLLRYIPDVHALPVPIEPVSLSAALDLSQSELRSVSPIHLEYLRNMEVGASMSFSILVDQKLWGLIACHHSKELHVSSLKREHGKILSQLFSRLLTLHQQRERERRRVEAKSTQIALFDLLSRADNLVDALVAHEQLILDLTHATGAIVKVQGTFARLGAAPTLAQAGDIVASISFDDAGVFATNNFNHPDKSTGICGVVAVKLSFNEDEAWILWVRPEVISEVSWAGEPVKVNSKNESEILHPRRSFSIWKETVSGLSHEWTEEELSGAEALQQYLQLRIQRDRAEHERSKVTAAVKDSNQKLVQFVDTVAHDLRSPLLAVGKLAEWIEKDLGDSIRGTPKENLDLLQKRVSKMKAQLHELLDYSKAGNFRAEPRQVDVGELVTSIVDGLKSASKIEFRIDEVPSFQTVKAPLEHVFSNLIENAVKHSGQTEGEIEIGCKDEGRFYNFYVADHGKGIPVEYLEEVFLPLRSLKDADSESHGMGLAFVKRIVEQAGGKVSLTSAIGQGSCFSFTWKKVWDMSDDDNHE
ncbi:MAG: GAF domain-containing protein [Cyanobacteria bacterium SZAS-4]|nr:GAF domain-containing protein [Cyanobacteria bacterium SZAS-4]